jgi:hypothetical protein
MPPYRGYDGIFTLPNSALLYTPNKDIVIALGESAWNKFVAFKSLELPGLLNPAIYLMNLEEK